MEQGDGPSSGSHLEEIYIKSEVPDAELEHVKLEDTVKDEPFDWLQEPQASSSPGFHAVTFKREVENDCTEACRGHAEAEDKLREGSSGACNTSAVHQGPAGASQGSADSLPSDVSGSGSGVEAAPPDRLMSRPLLCEHCDYSTGKRDLMELHLRLGHKLGCYYECELCDYATMYMISLKRHVVARHEKGNWYEGQCGRYQYSGMKMTGKQRRGKHGKKKHKCDLCGSLLATEFSSETHKKGVLDNNMVYKCEVCEYSPANETNLEWSLSGNHKLGCLISKPDQSQFYIRKLNDYSSAFKPEHEVHEAIKHIKGNLFKCEFCDYSSAYKCNVKSHLASKHAKGHLFKCELCDYYSAQKNNVILHVASKHGKGRQFRCDVCDYSSARKNDVKLHRASKHGKGQLFKCEICDFSCARKDRLEQHRASKHDNDQLFKCEICDFSSARKDRLKQHRASKHGKGQLFKCEKCDFFCARKDNVKAHLARKHGWTNSFPFWQ